jgi:SAM-dependent methyltransferase
MNIAAVHIPDFRSAYEKALLENHPSPEELRWRLSRFDRGINLVKQIEVLGKRVSGLRMLDLGAAHGGDCAACVACGARVIASDYRDYGYSLLRRYIHGVSGHSGRMAGVVADGNQLFPFGDEVFDVALALGIIEHVKDLERFFRETYRILRPGGLAIVEVHVALKCLSADPLYGLPITAALPMPLRKFVAQRFFGRSYPYPLGPRTFYSASTVARPARKAGFDVEAGKYFHSPIVARIQHWPMASLWLDLLKRYAFDFIVLRKQS